MGSRVVQDVIDLIRGKATLCRCKNSKKVLSVPYIEPKSTYKHIICIQGFGDSGSSAVVDLLSEFDNITAKGIGNPALKSIYPYEIDFFRDYGGLLDLMEAFRTQYQEIKNFKLKNFITLSEWFYSQKTVYTDKYMELTKEFVNKLVDFTIPTATGCDGNAAFLHFGHKYSYSNFSNELVMDGKEKNNYILKDLSIEEYIKLAHEYLVNVLKTFESKDYMVLDQFVSNGVTDFELLRKFIGEFKHIAVYRDPRDIYAEAIQTNNDFWIPREPEKFVKWYKRRVSPYMEAKHKDFYMLRFEDLILDYENVKNKIIDFIGVGAEHHIAPKSCLKPDVSCKNIGRYKVLNKPEELAYIETNLKEYCYYE